MFNRELFAEAPIEMRHEVGEVALTLGADDHVIVITYKGEGMDLDDLTSSLFSVVD